MPNLLVRTTSLFLLAGMLFLLVCGGMLSYVLHGPYYSPDTTNYFNFAQHLGMDSRWISIYSPAYPFLLYAITSAGVSLFKAAHLLILIQYAVGVYFLYSWARLISTHYRFNQKKERSFLFLLLIVYHSWWSFRVLTWAHADSTFYCLLIVWIYFLSRCYLKSSFKLLTVLCLISAVMIWVKLNALALIIFYALLIVLDNNRNKWLAPFGLTTTAYFGYRYLSHYQFLDIAVSDSTTGFGFPSAKSMGILANNLGELFISTLGFFFSDFLTAQIPIVPATIGGGLLLLALGFLALKELKKELSLASLFLLFGVAYLLCLLAFLQMIGSEEINYRTIFPCFLSCSGYGLIKLLDQNKTPDAAIMVGALLICGHTLVGHLWVGTRMKVNALFEAEAMADSEMIQRIRLLDQTSPGTAFVTNRPELLGLLLDDPFVVHYDPEFEFIHGKRRPVSVPKRLENRAALMGKLLKGEVVVVIFGEDEGLMRLNEQKGIMVTEFPEGVVLRGD